MSKQKKPSDSQDNHILKIPDPEELPEFWREQLIGDMVEQGIPRAEAEQQMAELIEMIAEPGMAKLVLRINKIAQSHPPHLREGILDEALQMAIKAKEEAENPQPELKIWTDAEAGRRSKPKSGTPDLP